MSLKTWKKKFYPVAAVDVEEEDALEHSIQKWEGLRPVHLKEHQLHSLCGGNLEDTDANHLEISTGSCALCVQYRNNKERDFCKGCPLFESRGGFQCDQEIKGETDSPWWFWANKHRAQPMLKALRKAKAWAKKNPRKVAASCGDDSMPRPENKV